MLTYKLNLTPRLGGSKSDGNAVSTFCKTQFAHWAISGAPRPSFKFERRSLARRPNAVLPRRVRVHGREPAPTLSMVARVRNPSAAAARTDVKKEA